LLGGTVYQNLAAALKGPGNGEKRGDLNLGNVLWLTILK